MYKTQQMKNPKANNKISLSEDSRLPYLARRLPDCFMTLPVCPSSLCVFFTLPDEFTGKQMFNNHWTNNMNKHLSTQVFVQVHEDKT